MLSIIIFIILIAIVVIIFSSPKKYFFDKKHNYKPSCIHKWENTGELNGNYCVLKCKECGSEKLVAGSGPSG